MKTITGKVRCQYWPRAETIEIEVPDDATEDQIEEALREVALDAAGLVHNVKLRDAHPSRMEGSTP